LKHALSLSVVRDGLKMLNYQLKSAIGFWWKNIKTSIGAKASQSFGLKNNGGAYFLEFKDISHKKVGYKLFIVITLDSSCV
jgi:hypothetical protein